jgi:hypothetical protein
MLNLLQVIEKMVISSDKSRSTPVKHQKIFFLAYSILVGSKILLWFFRFADKSKV